MADAIVVLNAGSSSLKFSLFVERGGELAVGWRGQVVDLLTAPRFVAKGADGSVIEEKSWAACSSPGHAGALEHLLGVLRERLAGDRLVGVGHRVVHGGARYARPLLVDAGVLADLRRLEPLAPLHQPHNLAPIAAILERAPRLPQVACFDTAFHRSNPDLAQMFGLPHAMFEQGVRRYGFHGLSYEYVASVLPRLDPAAAGGRTVVLHLGSGSSLCALEAGRSVASTMGFSALDGVPMGTRSGSVDPGVLIYLMRERGMDLAAVERLLYGESGLLGVSGISSDMRALLASDAPRAQLAVDLYCYRVRREIGSLAAALGGVDALVFTGGIGENAHGVRGAICRDSRWLGVDLDEAANLAGDDLLSRPSSRVRVWRMATDEELMIARHVQRVLSR